MAYLDHNATVPMDEAHRDFLTKALKTLGGNPSSVHASGRVARSAIESARRHLAREIGARPGEIVFTSGATEAIHLGLMNLVRPGDRVVVSAVEHPAVWGALEQLDARIEIAPVDEFGRVDIDDFVSRVDGDTACAVMMAAQNEIGNIYPVKALAERLGHVPLFSDCVQLLGKAAVNVGQMGVAAASFSGHKIGALSGVGALWMDGGSYENVTLRGGPQERGRRAGTENVLGIISFGYALEYLEQYRAHMPRLDALTKALTDGLMTVLDGVTLHGDSEKRLANTASFRVDGVPGDLFLQSLDLEGFNVSSGSACSAGSVEPSSVLLALGLDEVQARQGIRISLGPRNSQADIDALLAVVPGVVERIRRHSGDA